MEDILYLDPTVIMTLGRYNIYSAVTAVLITSFTNEAEYKGPEFLRRKISNATLDGFLALRRSSLF